MLDLDKYMQTYYEESTPKDFYREVFPQGELAEQGHQTQGKYNAIGVELTKEKYKDGMPKIKRHIITDDLQRLDTMLDSENFIIISPITYIGKNRSAENSRFIYGIAIDLDGITKDENMRDLFYQMNKVEYIPIPTYIVTSGTGLHLYYLLTKPIPCFKNIIKELSKLKKALTRRIWNGYVTSLEDKVQFESIFQGFRLVGGVSKLGTRTKCYKVGEKVNIDYLNGFVPDSEKALEITYKSNLTLTAAKEKYPEWYEKRIEKKQPRATWTCKKDLYEWWKRQIMESAKVGHRYYCLMCLSIYAKKCGVSKEELEKDSFRLLEHMERLTDDEKNHFTEQDVMQSLELYNDNYYTFPIYTISELTDIRIEKNKRNHRKQSLHLKMARSNLAIMSEDIGKPLQGRPTKKDIILEWQKKNPDKKKADCIRDTGLSKPTVYKWWKEV